jgi:hypothetical protein
LQGKEKNKNFPKYLLLSIIDGSGIQTSGEGLADSRRDFEQKADYI